MLYNQRVCVKHYQSTAENIKIVPAVQTSGIGGKTLLLGNNVEGYKAK